MMGAGMSDQFLTGMFIDSPVEGLEYETPTHTGITDAAGTFMYHEGDTIRFYIGDIMLGEAMAKSMMTPVDLVNVNPPTRTSEVAAATTWPAL